MRSSISRCMQAAPDTTFLIKKGVTKHSSVQNIMKRSYMIPNRKGGHSCY